MPQISFLVWGQDNVSDGWDISDSFSDGVGLMGTARIFWDLGDKMGYLSVLGAGSTKKYSVVDDIVWQPPAPGRPPFLSLDREEGNPWVVNTFLYQEFWRADENSNPETRIGTVDEEDLGEHERKAYLWLAGTVSDESPSFARWNVLGTVEALGPLSSRPMDRMGLAGWYTAWNDSYKNELRLIGVPVRNVFGFELYYNFAINPWLHLTVDLQLVQNLNKGDDLAVIPGTRLVLEF
jgi:hypothetical protein